MDRTGTAAEQAPAPQPGAAEQVPLPKPRPEAFDRREAERPLKVAFEHDPGSDIRFARRRMERAANVEMREARYNANADISVA